MNDNAIMKMIQEHEGFRDHVYPDSLGNPTCGWGHHLAEGSEVPLGASEAFFKQDYFNAIVDYASLIKEYSLPLDSVRRAVLINMLFNMGLDKVRGFKKMLAALMNGDWERAAAEMENSKWHNQVGSRAIELEKMMREGD